LRTPTESTGLRKSEIVILGCGLYLQPASENRARPVAGDEGSLCEKSGEVSKGRSEKLEEEGLSTEGSEGAQSARRTPVQRLSS